MNALSVKFAGKTYEVGSVNEAAAKWCAFRDQCMAGVSQIGNGVKVRNERGQIVASVSYNGRIWNPDGTPLRALEAA